MTDAAEASQARLDDAVFRPVRAGNSLEDTTARLMQTIRLGVVPPGQALPSERELAVRFSVSRDTVREAIRELSDTGYLRSRRGRYGGTFVSDPLPDSPIVPVVPPTAAELDDLLGLREILEVGAARAAAARTLDAEARALLWTRLAEVSAASTTDYRRLDSRLHLTIGEIAGVPSVVTVLADNRTRLNELLDSFPLLPRNIEHSNRQHEAIVMAILSGNQDGAADAVREHLEGSAALLRGFLA
ncbi:MAG TPA: FCD domain-containing protein [Pseudolysinimonas sp.]|jgi:DNA-binding FadR family transcriptional regulator|nr:FCD domain-containing protein [Pseudolysinimonas sp.]